MAKFFTNDVKPVRCPDSEVVIISCKWAIGSTGAVGTQAGNGATLTRNDVGDYTVQLVDGAGNSAKVVDILFAKAELLANDEVGRQVRIKALSASAGTLTLTVLEEQTNAFAVAEAASGDVLMVLVAVKLSNSSR